MSKNTRESQYFLYTDANFRVLALHGVTPDGHCECGNPECKAILKHPFSKNWQNTPYWSEEQLENMNEMNLLDNFGVLVDGHLIIDIDPRNGGMDSYHKLVKDTQTDYMKESKFIVETGGGGWHIYFKNDTKKAYKTSLSDYPGIDFKTSGFVVGAGSLHESGQFYQIDKGDPSNIEAPPSVLLALLEKPAFHRGLVENKEYDVGNTELQKMLSYIDNTESKLHYDDWISIGMALHHTTNGDDAGFKMWDEFSERSDKYDDVSMFYKWKSFGKTTNPVTLGTIKHMAEQGGYVFPVTFSVDDIAPDTSSTTDNTEYDDTTADPVCPVDLSNIDITSPPKNTLVYELMMHIRANLRRKRDLLSIMASLSLVGNLAGMRYTDEVNTTTNALWCGVADSGTGKDAVLSTCSDIYQRLEAGPALHGRIKSEQEIVRNLVRQQPNFYMVDEFGKFLKKLRHAEEKGSTPYLEGIVGTIMDAYSKGNSFMGISGDMKHDIQVSNEKLIKKIKSDIEEGYTEFTIEGKTITVDQQKTAATTTLNQLIENRTHLRMGIKMPFLSLVGLTTSSGFDDYFTKDTVMDGFMGRMIVFRETDSAPKLIKSYTGQELPTPLFGALSSLFHGETFSYQSENHRIQNYNHRKVIPSSDVAHKLMEKLTDYFDAKARFYQGVNGFEALTLRAMEAVRKVSLILAAPSGLREVQHVEWATALILHDIETKMSMVVHHEGKNSKQSDVKGEALEARMLNFASNTPLARSVIIQKSTSKHFTKEQCTQCFDHLISQNKIQKVLGEKSQNGRTPVKYKKV